MSIDLFVGIVVVAFFVKGYRRGIIVALFGMAAIVLGIVLALALSQQCAAWLMHTGLAPSRWAPFISYVLLFTVVLWLVRMLGNALEALAKTMMLGAVNRLIGGALYALAGVLLASSLLWLATQMNLLSEASQSSSATYESVAPIAPWAFDHIGEVLPFAKNVFVRLQDFFEAAKQLKA